MSPQRAAFQVPERYADQLKMGQQVTFRVAAIPGREFTGRVDFVDPVVQLPGRTIMVKALTPNPQAGAPVGDVHRGPARDRGSAQGRRHSGGRRGSRSRARPSSGSCVEGKATRRQVDLGVRTPGFVEARSGVEPAEQVVVGGQERLSEGAPVAPKVVDRTPVRPQES